ncbi:MAG: thiamine phosphate synthase [Variibacter sp.]|nr:thiamine phosphate synthase [Variibacter sp.]
MRLPSPPLLVITDRQQARAPLETILQAIFSAGCRWASLREKDLPQTQQRALAARLAPVARRHGATLTLHGSPELARAAGLDGVHLAAGGDAKAARALLGPRALIGISIHGEAEAMRLDPAEVDYAVAGPAFATASKPGYGPALGVEGLVRIARAAPVPVLPVGGIDTTNAGGLMRAGAAGIAVMGGLMRSADPAGETRRLLQALA